MSTLTKAAVELREMAIKAKVTIDQCTNVLALADEREESINASRRASPDDRAAIDAIFGELNGELSEMAAGDILVKAGVTRKQGTMSYVNRQKRLLLTHQPN